METVIDAVESKVKDEVESKVKNQLLDSVWRQFGYVWNYNSNIQDLAYQAERLKAERVSLQHRIDEAKRNGEEIEETVRKWLTSVDDATKDADKILDDNNTANKVCFMGFCLNFKTRYQLSRRVKKKTPVLVGVRGEGHFERISYRPALQGMGPVKYFQVFESRTRVVSEILRALKDSDASLIGLYGVAGVGKTTLAKRIAQQVMEEGIFKVVLATVTQKIDLKGIQQEIADWLDFKFDVESAEVRAARLYRRLKQEKKVLIILDDVWEGIGREEIGIPSGNDDKGCKILTISRNPNVLSNMGVEMGFQFKLNVLEDEEAWHLFQNKAGVVEDPNIQPVAVEVTRRCAGLPALIVAIAAALKSKKEIYEWTDALEQLNQFDNLEMDEQIKMALELSTKL